MSLKKADDKVFAFEMKGHDGLKNHQEMHMHALDITWDNDKTMKQEWVSYNAGKKKDSAIFVLTKK
jgi:hypothetical protein